MKKGINAWSLPSNLSLNDLFKTAKEAGFDTIELNVTEPVTDSKITDDLGLIDTAILPLNVTNESLLEIKKVSETFDLPVSSISTSLHWTYPLNHEDCQIREKGKAIVRKMIEICASLGGNCVLVVPGVVTEKNDYERCYQFALETFKELSEFAKAHDVVIGVENVWNKFLLSPLEMRQFIDEIDHSHVKVYFDAGNVLQFGFPEQWIRTLAHRIVKVHIKDFNRGIGNITGFTTLLNGDMDWKELIIALKEINYTDEVTCELGPYKTNPIQLAFDTSQAMDFILNQDLT